MANPSRTVVDLPCAAVALALALTSAWPARASADDAPATDARASEAPAPATAAAPGSEESRRLLEEGQRLYSDDADYAQALDRFRRSYRLSPSWQALSGIALVYQQQGHDVEAYDTYQQLLDEFEAVLGEERLARARRRAEALRARIGTIALDAAQPGLRVVVDGVVIGTGPLHREVRVMPGPHTVVATLAGHDSFTHAIDVAAGGSASLSIRLAEALMDVKTTHTVRPMPVWIPWATIGAGALLAGGGALLHLDATHDVDLAHAAENRELMSNPNQLVDLRDREEFRRAEIKNGVAIGMWVGAGATLVTGIVLALRNTPHTRVEIRRVPRVVPLPGGAALELSF